MQAQYSDSSNENNKPEQVSYELATRVGYLTCITIWYNGAELTHDKATTELLSLALPEGWSNDESELCLKYALAMMLAAISEHDQELACAQEQRSKQNILSILVRIVDDITLHEPIVEGILAVFKRRIEIEAVVLGESPSESSITLIAGGYNYTTSMTIKAGGSEYHWGDGDKIFLLVHLHDMRQDVTRLLFLWTWSTCAPKLKWGQ